MQMMVWAYPIREPGPVQMHPFESKAGLQCHSLNRSGDFRVPAAAAASTRIQAPRLAACPLSACSYLLVTLGAPLCN